MHLSAEFIHQISQILNGRCVRTRQESEKLRLLLQSREEFLAWLFVSDKLGQRYPEVASKLKEQAARKIVQPSTKRIESNFPLAQRRKVLAIETATKHVLEAMQSSRDVAEKLSTLTKAQKSRLV